MKLSLPWRIGLVIALTGALAAGLAALDELEDVAHVEAL